MGGRSCLKCGDEEFSWVTRNEDTCGSMRVERSQSPLDHRLLECSEGERSIGDPSGETIHETQF